MKFVRKSEKRSTIEAKQNAFNINNFGNFNNNNGYNNNKNESNGNDASNKKIIPLNKILNRPGSFNV
jgi:hypothetical protein